MSLINQQTRGAGISRTGLTRGCIGLVVLYLVSACSLPLARETEPPLSPADPSPTPTIETDLPFPVFHTPALPVDQLSTESTVSPAIKPTLILATQPPEASSDLLFLEDGRLMRWDHVTNYKTPLVEGVVEYSLSQDGRRVALLRSTKVSANGSELFNLDLLDLKNKQVTSLLKSIPRIFQLRASADGQMIAYQAVDESVTITAIAINNPQEVKSVGVCRQVKLQTCSSLTWSPDGYSLAWEDDDGIWLSKLGQGKPQLLASHQIEVTDPKGLASSITVSFGNLNWSPKGRYLLTQIQTLSGIGWSAILDTRQGRWNEVPDTFKTSVAGDGNATWMPGGEVLVISNPQQKTSLGFSIYLWKIMPTGKEFFVMDRQFRISSDHPELLSNSALLATVGQAGWIAAISEKMLCFSTQANSSKNQLDLFWFELDSDQLDYQSYSADNVQSILWSPDGSGALVIQKSGLVIFGRRSQPGSLTLFQPENSLPSLFSWAPPTLRE